VSEELAEALAARLGGTVTGLRRLSGGASRETWSFALDGTPLILRRDPPRAARTAGMLREAALFRAAAAAGVPVPELVDASDDGTFLGSAFLVMAHVDGETIPRKILRDPEYAAARPRLARQCGEVLARLHTIPVEAVPGLEDQDQVAQYRAVLDGVAQPHPTFELAFRWLEEHRPQGSRRTVVHGDFRNGNLIVGPEGIRSVLDWELAHAGDPLEDLGWLCVKSWRFGVALPVGGFGTYEDLLAGYGGDVDREALRWWEVLGTLKWGIMCIMQAVTHTSGAVRSVELAAIGRRVCEVEWDLLELLPEGGAGR
jgi:aminoglycoside phosphotransferase (APT) family kinase protein